MKPKPQYRIRGLQSQSNPPSEKPPRSSSGSDEIVPLIRTALGVPCLDDYVLHPPLDLISEYFTGIEFFTAHGRKFCPIKPYPVALIPHIYLDDQARFPELQPAIEYYQVQQQLKKEISQIMDLETIVHNNTEALAAIQSPLGCALAVALFYRAEWPDSLCDQSIKVAGDDPVGAFLLATCAYPSLTRNLFDVLRKEPRLAWALSEIPGLRRHLPAEFILDSMANESPYIELMRHALNPLQFTGQDVLNSLCIHSTESPIAAALCYGFLPEDSRRKEWLEVIAKSKEAALYGGRLLALRGLAVPHSKLLHPLCAIACDEGRYHYLWFRDVEYLFAHEAVGHLWPSPWACELIEDLDLPPEHWHQWLTDLDPEAPLTTTIHLWAASRLEK